jgi:glucan phosphoethanolaminetransferase (alkaline phosphatase superfamily)
MFRKRHGLVVAFKLLAAAILVGATAGLLWHAHGTPEHWAFRPPPWWMTVADGWYPRVAEYVAWLWRSGPPQALIYAAVSALCVLAVFAVPFIGNTFARIAASVVLLIGIAYDLTLFDIGGGFPTRSSTETVLGNVRFGFDGTVQLYLAEVIRNLALVAAALVAFCWRPPPLPRRAGWLPSAVVVAGAVGMITIFWRTDAHTTVFPSPFGSFANAYVVLRSADQPVGKLDYPGTPASRFRKVVFIVDESVRGDYLSINKPAIPTTPFLLSRHAEMANFGEAVSAANCSLDTRRALRFGYREQDIGSGQATRRLAPFWSHAKLAGLKTVYIDSYGTATGYVNDMRRAEAKLIDQRIVVDDMPQYARDERIARRLRELLLDPAPMFIFVEKFGIHVPYDKMYPPSQNPFDADMTRFDLRDRPNMLKHYENGLRWSVDRFFEEVLQPPVPRDTFILYTSDHGQTLSEENRLTTHCNQGPNAVRGEADVPLFALTDDPQWRAALQAAARENFGRASHYEIFPTLLLAIGYDRDWTRLHYGGSLLEPVGRGKARRFWAMGAYRQFDPAD